MSINNFSVNTKTKYLLGVAGLVLVSMFCVAFSFTTNTDFDLARQQVLLRKIGHEVLLHSGDSTSRVLPVKKIAEGEYQIRFENQFTFQPDSLVKIISSTLALDNLSNNYVVSVLNCAGTDIIFGYAISASAKDDIIACSGRRQPKSCYLINITFQNNGISATEKGYLIGGLPLLAFIGLIISGSVKNRDKKDEPLSLETDCITIGNTIFDPVKRQMTAANSTTGLTGKENKLLLIFANSPGVTIERNRLQKEIWEDEGVIVGRSLDMFISKLRKKLEHDPSIQLVNIHGKGYKLQING